MCGIVGAFLMRPDEGQIETLRELFRQSQVRGRHATGFSLFDEELGEILTRKEPIDAQHFVRDHFSEVTKVGYFTLRLIGHCRYSTSDLRFNQPIANEDIAVVHNGVISQSSPDSWQDTYGYQTETSNDSELLHKATVAGRNPLEEFPEASIAALELRGNGSMRAYRNLKRPLYLAPVENGFFVASTKDIAMRAGLNSAVSLEVGRVYEWK